MVSIIWKKLSLIWVNYLLLFMVKSDQVNPFSSYWRYFYFLCKVPKKRVCRKRFKMEIAAWNCGTAWQIFFVSFSLVPFFCNCLFVAVGLIWVPSRAEHLQVWSQLHSFCLLLQNKIRINDLTSNRCNVMQFITTFYEKSRLWPDLKSTIIQVCMCFSYHKIRP